MLETQPATAAGLVAILEAASAEVASVGRVRDLAASVRSLRPHVAVFDVAAIEPRRRPDSIDDPTASMSAIVTDIGVPTLAFVADVSTGAVHRLLDAGVMGVVPRTAGAGAILESVVAVASGVQHLHPLAVAAWMRGVRSSSGALDTTLSERELRVLDLIAAGSSNAEIAELLGVSLSAVKASLERVFVKLDVADRAHAVGTAIRRGLIH